VTAADVRYRPATEADLPACGAIWRDGLNDYLVPLGQYEVPADNPTLRLLHAHTLATDPEWFWVATSVGLDAATDSVPATPEAAMGDGGEHLIAFASAVRRGPVWFLSMLFVRPGQQANGVGRSQPARPTSALSAVTGTFHVRPPSSERATRRRTLESGRTANQLA